MITCVHPVYPHEMIRQHSGTVLVLFVLACIAYRNNLSDLSFSLIATFMILHIIGARWIYSHTPYDTWIKDISGFSINSYFGFRRNHYDRFVHFMFGFLFVIPMREIYHRWFLCPKAVTAHLAFLFIMTISAINELAEWLIAVACTPESAEAFNGMQGDIWDAQKDMVLALLGSIIMILFNRLWHAMKQKEWI